eukprot:388434_1
MNERELSMSREESITMTRIASKTKSFGYRQNSVRNTKRARLQDVLRNKYGYDAFIQHLSSEFCLENMVSLTEFLQFKLYIHRKCAHSELDKNLYYWLSMLPLDSLPRSEIVYANEAVQNVHSDDEKHCHDTQDTVNVADMIMNDAELSRQCKFKAYDLWAKYVRTGSEYEVNISSAMRSKYRGLSGNKQQWLDNEEYNDLIQLRDMFDDCCTVTRRLMAHSFQRFKDT